MFRVIEEPSPSASPVDSSAGDPIVNPLARTIIRPRQPNVESGSGWPSMLFDGAQAPIFEPKVVIMSASPIGDWPALVFNATDDTLAAGFIVSTRNGDPRWSMEIGTHGPEPGGNQSSDFLINRFDDTGQVLFPSPFRINRATGMVTIPSLNLGPVAFNPLPVNAVNDAAAQAAGVAVGGVYRNGSVLMVRVV